MKPINPASDIVSLSEFRANVSEMLERAQQGRPIVITQNGRGAGVLVSADEFEQMSQALDFHSSVARGMTQLAAGKGVPHATAVARFRATLRELKAQAKARRKDRAMAKAGK